MILFLLLRQLNFAWQGSVLGAIRSILTGIEKESVQMKISGKKSSDHASASGVSRNDVFEFAAEKYNTKPEYPWLSAPEHAVLRHSRNNKWYAVIMKVRAERLGLPDGGYADIMNVKCGKLMTGSLLMCSGILPAYHMNKSSWVSVLLDKNADREQVMSLLQMSYEITISGAEREKSRTEPKEWLIPANPGVYDVEQDFSADGAILWNQRGRFMKGDIVYMYMAAPCSEIMYKCIVDEADIPDEGGVKLMRLRLSFRFEKGSFPLERLREHGVYSVRGTRGVPDSLSAELKAVCG